MSVKVTGSDQRLSLALPSEGQTWVRHGNEMVGAAPGGGGGGAPTSLLEVANTAGPISVAKPLTILNAAGDFNLPNGTVHGFDKYVRAGGPSTFVQKLHSVAGNITNGLDDVLFLSFTSATVPVYVHLKWDATISKWLLVGFTDLAGYGTTVFWTLDT
jgi:hypothetical protein